MPVKIFVPGLGNVPIPDEIPLEKTEEYVNSLAKKQGVELPLPAPPEQNIFERTLEAGIGGTKRLLSSQATALQSPFDANKAATEGIERQKAITERPGADLDELTRVYKEKGFLPAAGELVSQIPPAIAEQAPFLAESFASAGVGARIGALTPIPGGTIIGGAIGLFAPSFLAALGSNTERQAKEQLDKGAPVDVDLLKATGAAIPQGLLDAGATRLVFGKALIGKALGLSDKEIAKATEKTLQEKLTKLASEGTLGTIGRGTVKGAAVEIPTEVTQQVLERWQAGLPLADEDALKEYGETAYSVALLGPLGTVGRFSEKGQAKQELARREAVQEFERRNPDVQQLQSETPTQLEPQFVSNEANNLLANVDRSQPLSLQSILQQTGDSVSDDADATAVANELLNRGEIIQQPDGNFRFLGDEERIAPVPAGDNPYFYAVPTVRQTEAKPEGYEVTNPGINVTRKAKTEEEAANIKTQMDARVKRDTDVIDEKIKEQEKTIEAIKYDLNISLASDMTDEQLSEEHDKASASINESRSKIQELNNQRDAIAQETQISPIGDKQEQEQGYEVRLYRPGQTAKVMNPFATKEQAEDFIVQNAPAEQQQAIDEDSAPHRESLRSLKQRLVAGEPTEEGVQEAVQEPVEGAEQTGVPQPTPEMQQRVQAVTSRLRGVLDQMGLQSIGLNVSNKLTDMVNGKITPIDGMYLDRVIHASLSSSRGVLPTFGHETVHAMRELGMFSDKEWDILTRKAKSEWLKEYATEERYAHLSPEEQIEEAIADAFGYWMAGEYKPTGVVRGLLNRIKLFLESLGSTLRGQGFDNTEKVFQRALSGELRGTREERPSEGKQFALPKESRSKLGLYSALADSIQNIQTNAAPAAGWKQAIQGFVNKGQVKKEEVEWSGINDWLDLQQGKVTKEQVAEYLREGGVQVEETVLGGPRGLPEILNNYFENTSRPQPTTTEGWIAEAERLMRAAQQFQANGDKERANRIFSIAEAMNEYAEQGETGALRTKYSKYTLPGGENYREVLLTLPEKKNLPVQTEKSVAREVFEREMMDKYGATTFAQAYNKMTPSETDKLEMYVREERNDAKSRAMKQDKANNYKSPHWDQPNVLAHILVEDRTDADGKRVLFVQEIQSDWGQEGKKKGFDKKEFDVVDGNGSILAPRVESRAEAEQIASQYQSAVIRESAQTPKVPSAPFVTKTEGWLNLALKRIMVMAAEGGYDKVAFTTGAQNAERFSLDKKLREIAYEPAGEGRYEISATDLQGQEVISEDEVSLERIEELVGKEIAEKVARDEGERDADGYREWRYLRGDNLKVEAKGMRAFYDTIVLTALKKLLPKVGGGQMTTVEVSGKVSVAAKKMGAQWVPGYSKDSFLQQPGFDITPAMREKVAEGLPKFALPMKHALSLEDYENLSPEARRVMEEDFLYSPLNRLIANAPKKLDGQPSKGWLQWLNANAHMAGGKDGELFWTGLDEWLVNQSGQKISKERIAEYLREFDNPRDVVYEAAGRPEIGVIDVTDQLPELVDPNGNPVNAAYEFIVTVGGQDFSFIAYEHNDEMYPYALYNTNDEYINSFGDIDSIKEDIAYEANESLGIQGNTKYSQYVLDGGDNYREIPVVLSGPSAKKIVFNFYNTHFPDANVLYHLRTNDRQDVDGNNVLFIEEVQSDWAQKGREAGFTQTQEEQLERQRKIKELEDNLYLINEMLKEATIKENRESLIALRKDLRDKQDKLEPIPVGPYIQDTGKWVELAAKRIIAMAVNGGYDRVAFINPAQAYARFPIKKDGGSTKEGFENFYGKILPNKLNSLLKKYGSKVEVIELPVEGDASKWATDSDTSQQLGFVVTSELADSVRKNGFPKHALPMKVLAQGKRKPTTSSTGAQIHPTKNGVRNFWRWFGDGELVDSMGRPRMFYHGSPKDIEAFKRGTADAIFFAPSPEPMNVFINYKVTQDAYNEKPYAFGAVYPVYINAKNVFDYENPEHVDAIVDEVMQNAKSSSIGIIRKAVLHPYYSVKTPTEKGVEEEFLVAPEAIVEPKKFSRDALKEKLQKGYWPTFETGEVINALKKLGFDGFHVQENFGGRFYKNVAVFSPNNIKSAVGNNGQFSPNDKRTQHALQMPRTKISQAISRASKQDSLRQDPLFATPFSSPAAGINVLNYGMNNTPTIKDNKNFIQRAITNNSGKLYGLFQLSGLVDVFGDKVPPLRAYYNSIRTMMGGRDIYIHESSELADEWQRLNARSLKDGNDMATVMNRSTYYRYDPSIGKKPQTKEEVEIQRMYDALPAPYKKLYGDVKNFYQKRFDQFFKLLEKRVAKSVTDPDRAKAVLEEIKKKYNYYKQIEPYFPLTRFGEYWVRYKEDGQEKFEMFENASDQDTFKNKIMSTPGVTDVTNGKKLITLRGDIGASDFVNNIMDSLDAAKGEQMGMAEIEDMKDSVWQLYLSSLPELSMRKQFMHRANVPGYSNDALRAFQKNAFHGAYHMARLEHAPEVYGKLNDVRRYVVDLQEKNHPDAVSASELYNSVASEQRQKQIWRPDDTTTPFRIAGQVGFLYYLSSAASAVTNLTQNLTHAFPIIGSEFGYDKSAKEFARAYKQFFESPSLDDFSDIKKSKSLADAALQTDRGIRSVFDITRTLEQLKSEAKTQKDKDRYQREIDAINYLYQTVISRSQAMDLAGATDKVTVSSHWSQVGMRFIAMAFHGAEILNRTTTGIVAYRLQMEKLEKEQPNLAPEQRHEIAVRRASEIVDQSHFNYSEANRSPFMGNLGQMGKVIFMFKSYAIAETTFLFNTFRVWSKVLRDRWKGTPLEQKAIDDSRKARRTLIGVLGMQGMFAGVLGLPTPLMMIVMALANSIGGGDDDEEDIPAKVEFKQWLVETFGDNLAQAIAYGPASYVTGADFNSRVGLNNLWFRDPNPAEDELDQTKNFLLNLGGPMVGLTTNFVQGITLMNQGEIGRGFEKMVPNVVKAPIQARRFMNEGATTVKGDQILDEFSTQELGLAFLGFTPTRLSLAYQQQSEQRGAMFQANLDKKRVLIKFNLAAKSNDFDALEDIEKDIERYNKKYPSDPITFDTLRKSLKATAAAQKETQHGLRIPKKQRAIAEGVSWLDWEKLEED
jgi:hypothetical protein